MAREQWTLDTAHSTIGFSVRHLVISKVHGRFGKWGATVYLDEAAPENSTVDVQIDVASIDTNEPQRDAHLRSADFFDVERYPHITFKSVRVEPNAGKFRIVGDITIHGITRQIAFAAEHTGDIRDPWGNDRRGFTASATIHRGEFGMTFNQVLETGGVVVGDRIEVSLELELTKPVAFAVAS